MIDASDGPPGPRGAGLGRSGSAPGQGAPGVPGRIVAGLAALLVLGIPSGARAQESGSPLEEERGLAASRANLGLFVGALSPLNDLTTDPASFGTSIAVSPVLGADASFWLGAGRLGIGLQTLFGPGELQVEATEFQGAIPDDLGDADAYAGTVTLLYRLLLSGAQGRIEPYFGLGAGVRHLAVDAIAEPEVEDSTDPLGTIAAGAHVWFARRLAIRFELRDHLLSFESPTTGDSRLQNDIAVTVGVATRIR